MALEIRVNSVLNRWVGVLNCSSTTSTIVPIGAAVVLLEELLVDVVPRTPSRRLTNNRGGVRSPVG